MLACCVSGTRDPTETCAPFASVVVAVTRSTSVYPRNRANASAVRPGSANSGRAPFARYVVSQARASPAVWKGKSGSNGAASTVSPPASGMVVLVVVVDVVVRRVVLDVEVA